MFNEFCVILIYYNSSYFKAFLDNFRSRLISQLIKGISIVLQVLLRYINGTINSTFFVPSSPVWPIIFSISCINPLDPRRFCKKWQKKSTKAHICKNTYFSYEKIISNCIYSETLSNSFTMLQFFSLKINMVATLWHHNFCKHIFFPISIEKKNKQTKNPTKNKSKKQIISQTSILLNWYNMIYVRWCVACLETYCEKHFYNRL